MVGREPAAAPMSNATTNTTHLLWVGRWIEVRRSRDGWVFKTGRDAADWLLA